MRLRLGWTHGRPILPMRTRPSSSDFSPGFRAFCQALGVFRFDNASVFACSVELGADARGRAGVLEEDGSERDVAGPTGCKLERVAARFDAAHADDRQAGRLMADAHGVERDG